MSEKQAKTAIISIGTNLGDKKRNIELINLRSQT